MYFYHNPALLHCDFVLSLSLPRTDHTTRPEMMHQLLFGLFMLVLYSHEISSCDNGWQTYNGNCYFLGDYEVTWATASSICKSFHNGHLAVIRNSDEDNFLRQLATLYTRGDTGIVSFWLDGSDSLIEGDWIWAESGQHMLYTNWYPGEPSNSRHGTDDCLVLYSPMAFGWDDQPCSRLNRFICERS